MRRANFNKRLAANPILLMSILSLCLMITRSEIQILYPQETAQTYSGSTGYSSLLLSTLTASFSTSLQYTMSAWVKMPTTYTTPSYTLLFKLSLNYSTQGNSERIILAEISSNMNVTFSTGTPADPVDDWDNWEGLTSQEMFPGGQWIFLAFGADTTLNEQYGFRYYPQSTTQQTIFYNTRTVPGPNYNITPSCTAFWGGDIFGSSIGQTLQFVRVYIDYVPTSQDEMLNLAIMVPGGTVYYVLLTTDYGAVQNLTFPIQYYQNLTEGFTTASLNPTYPATFGPFNSIMCRPGAILSYEPSITVSSGIIVAFDIIIHSPAATVQNVFSVRDSVSNHVSITTSYDPTDRLIKVQLQNPNWNTVCMSSTAINLDQRNRVVVELQVSNPGALSNGFYSGRIFVNQSIPSRTYFGNFGNNPLFEEANSKTLDICSTMVSGSSTLNSSIDGNYDMMNLMWYLGNESLYQNSSDPTCYLSGFLNPSQSACLICNPAYYLDGRVCVPSCPENTFVEDDTSSCQSCYYPSRYYTSTGYCMPCNNSCASCSGPSSDQCQSCYSGSYLLSSNSSCVTCNATGYYMSGTQCLQCNSSCLTCYGNASTNCLSCPNSAYYIPSDQYCIASDATTVQTANIVGVTSQVIFISVTASTVFIYFQTKAKSPYLMRTLQIMARITFMRLININYLTPLATFYNYTDLGQLGMPIVFNKMKDTTKTNYTRSSSLFVLNTQGDVTFNSYFSYSFSNVFLDEYGGMIFSSLIILAVYLILKIALKCFKDENSKTKAFLTTLTESIEKSLFLTILVSRYMYLCSSLIFNYAFLPLDGVYQVVSFVFAIFYTILLFLIFALASCAGFYHNKESRAKLKPIRPMLGILLVMTQSYHHTRAIGRFFAFWILLSDLIIVLVLVLLNKWPLAQLIVLIVLNAINIIISIPKSLFDSTTSKILMIGTELGFLIVNLLFLTMYFLENSGTWTAYHFQIFLSWSTIGINISILLFQIIVKVFEYFRLRKEKKRHQKLKKAVQNLDQLENQPNMNKQGVNIDNSDDSQLFHLRNSDRPGLSLKQSKKSRESRINLSRQRRPFRVNDVSHSQLNQIREIHEIQDDVEQSKKNEGITPSKSKTRRIVNIDVDAQSQPKYSSK